VLHGEDLPTAVPPANLKELSILDQEEEEEGPSAFSIPCYIP
jgi:hypothetical protein